MDVRKTMAAAAVLLATAGGLTACGGGDSGSGGGSAGGSPTDAAQDEFCNTLQNTGSEAKPSDVAAQMKSIGTPSDINDSARHGFEVLVDKMSQIDSANPSDSDIAKIAQDFKSQDLADVQAFISYYVQECAGGLLPSAGAS